MSEKEKEAQVSENETKGENFFFKHECTFIQWDGLPESWCDRNSGLLHITNFSVNCRKVLELGFQRGPFKSCVAIGWNICIKLRPFGFLPVLWCTG